MDLPGLLRVLRRHWAVVAIVLAVTAAGAATASVLIPASHRATGTMILLSPAPGDGSNAFAQAGSGVAAEALLSSVNSQSFGVKARDAGVGKDFKVEISGRGGGVILVLSTTSDAPDAAMVQFTKLTELLAKELLDVQKRGGATAAFITAQVLSSPIEATPLMGSEYRTMLVIVIFGVAVACAVAVALESVAASRERRRAPGVPARRFTDVTLPAQPGPPPTEPSLRAGYGAPPSPPQPYGPQPYGPQPYPPQPYPGSPYPSLAYPSPPYPSQPAPSWGYPAQPDPSSTHQAAPANQLAPPAPPASDGATAGPPAPALISPRPARRPAAAGGTTATRSHRPAGPPDAAPRRRANPLSPGAPVTGAGGAGLAKRATTPSPAPARPRPAARVEQPDPDGEG